MIRLRQTIERGMRHPWLGPLFVILFCCVLALLSLHASHDSDHGATMGEFCLGLTVMFGMIIVVRLLWRVTVSGVPRLLGRAPPVRQRLSAWVRVAAVASPPPLRL